MGNCIMRSFIICTLHHILFVELGSARMIIDILQKELLTLTTTLNTQDNNLALTEGFVNSNPR